MCIRDSCKMDQGTLRYSPTEPKITQRWPQETIYELKIIVPRGLVQGVPGDTYLDAISGPCCSPSDGLLIDFRTVLGTCGFASVLQLMYTCAEGMLYIHIYIYMRVCVCVCVCVYI